MRVNRQEAVQAADCLFSHIGLGVIERLDYERQECGERLGIYEASDHDKRHGDLV